MARKAQLDRVYVANTDIEVNRGLNKAALYKVSSSGNIIADPKGNFLLNPSSIQDDVNSNWAKHSTPGSSDPILQWISGGARTVTIEALVTKDTSVENGSKDNLVGELIQAANNVIGDIASKFAGVNLPSLSDALSLIGIERGAGNDLDINDRLNYYRSLVLPSYTEDGYLKSSPPLVTLLFGSALGYAPDLSPITKDSTVFIVEDIKINITKFLPNLRPMEAVVTITLVKYALKSQGTTDVPPPIPNDLSASKLLSY